MASNIPNPSRRSFLLGERGNAHSPLCPPWSDIASVTRACARCGDCIKACPEKVLKPGSGGFPEFDPKIGAGACTFCGACAEACGEDVFDITRARPWQLVAEVTKVDCLPHAGIHCETCRDACDVRAIRMRYAVGTPPVPEISADTCTGCGACAGVCPADAIRLFNPADERCAA